MHKPFQVSLKVAKRIWEKNMPSHCRATFEQLVELADIFGHNDLMLESGAVIKIRKGQRLHWVCGYAYGGKDLELK